MATLRTFSQSDFCLHSLCLPALVFSLPAIGRPFLRSNSWHSCDTNVYLRRLLGVSNVCQTNQIHTNAPQLSFPDIYFNIILPAKRRLSKLPLSSNFSLRYSKSQPHRLFTAAQDYSYSSSNLFIRNVILPSCFFKTTLNEQYRQITACCWGSRCMNPLKFILNTTHRWVLFSFVCQFLTSGKTIPCTKLGESRCRSGRFGQENFLFPQGNRTKFRPARGTVTKLSYAHHMLIYINTS
jgi:hypothetical protein